MKTTRLGVLALLGLSPILLALPVTAAYPALYWWRMPVSYSVQGCFKQAEKAMRQQGLQDIAVGSTDVYGHTENTAVAITCFQLSGKTEAVIMVTGSETAETSELRESLKSAF